VAVALWKAMGGKMFESGCRERAIDERNADGAKSTRDLTPSPPHRTQVMMPRIRAHDGHDMMGMDMMGILMGFHQKHIKSG